MLLNTPQVSAKLNISKATVHTLVKQGVLKDYGTTVPGGMRHQFLFDSREVTEVGRHLRKVGRTWRYFPPEAPYVPPDPYTEYPKQQIDIPSRSPGVELRVARTKDVAQKAIAPPAAPISVGVITGISQRLTTIEEKIDRLLALWS
jgi:hypothetical protein